MINNLETLLDLLPQDYESQCFETKAMQRKREIKTPKDLMMLILIYLTQGCSLLEISNYADMMGIAKISAVAFMKRFAKCRKWLERIVSQLRPGCLVDYDKSRCLQGYRIIALDASTVTDAGAVKRLWRLHYAIDLFEMKSLQYRITDDKTGESLTNFAVEKGDIVIADRAYGSKKSIEHCLASGGDFIFRLKSEAFRLYDEHKNRLNLPGFLEGLSEGSEAEITVHIESSDKKLIKCRVCWVKKSEEAIKQSRRKINRLDSKRQVKTNEKAKRFNDYIVVITSLPASISATDILSLYRLRWQVELYFKRLKSIMGFGELPKKKDDGIMAWLNGKLMIALLLEKTIAEAASFSPADYEQS